MIGRPRLHLREVDSTNERARALALAGAPHGTLVTADHQTAGRGRQGRRWVAPPGRAVLMSLVLRPPGGEPPLLPLAAAVAVCEACERCAAVRCEIKWPNDVWIERRKVAGILVEGRPQEGWMVLGTGVNVATSAAEFPPDLRAMATSLAIASRRSGGGAPGVEAVLAALVEQLERRLGDRPDAVLEAWRRRDALRGERVRWPGGEGAAEGITDGGALVVRTNAGRQMVEAGEVRPLD